MSIGTHEGDIDEIVFVKKFNRFKENYFEYLSHFEKENTTMLWMIRVTTKQFSKLSDQKVFTRSDCYLAKINFNINDLLKQNDYYLDEDLLNKNLIKYTKINMSGVSVKMTNSHNFQILKVGPSSFNNLFGNYELGAGASLFCMRKDELYKNSSLLVGWKTNEDKMISFFGDFIKNRSDFTTNQETCKQIKNFSCKEIENIINSTKSLQEKIFNGKELYDEPYTAWYFYHGDKITKLTTIPFSVTTGSGRSHGDYTIVLKPING